MEHVRDQKPPFDLDSFFARLRVAPTRLLMLDYDGTLAPFNPDPARAVPYPDVPESLDKLIAAGHTRVVIVSGRWTKDLVPLLGLKRRPEIWGSHGWERLHPSGDYHVTQIHPSALRTLVAADEWIADIEALGARAERKPGCLAFHWRGLTNSRITEIRAKLFDRWMEERQDDSLLWHDFDGGIELRAAGRGKGDVVKTLLGEVGADAAVAYLGDDLTDEDAFKALPNDAASILVRPQFRPTAAALWLRPPEELTGFLARWDRECMVR